MLGPAFAIVALFIGFAGMIYILNKEDFDIKKENSWKNYS